MESFKLGNIKYKELEVSSDSRIPVLKKYYPTMKKPFAGITIYKRQLDSKSKSSQSQMSMELELGQIPLKTPSPKTEKENFCSKDSGIQAKGKQKRPKDKKIQILDTEFTDANDSETALDPESISLSKPFETDSTILSSGGKPSIENFENLIPADAAAEVNHTRFTDIANLNVNEQNVAGAELNMEFMTRSDIAWSIGYSFLSLFVVVILSQVLWQLFNRK